jgi:cobalt/nickel transport system permease protein
VAFGLVWLVLLVASVWAGLGAFRLTRASWIALPFLLIALPLLFTRPGEPLFTLTPGPWTLTITDQGAREVATIVLRSWLSVQVALLLAFTTPFPDLIDALRALRLPRIMVSIISFMYRYLAVLSEEAGRMNRAKASRSAVVVGRAGGSLRWRAGVTGAMVGSLFLRSYERSERVYAAMLARGFQGQLLHEEVARPSTSAIVGALFISTGMVLFVVAAHVAGPTW